MTLKDLEGHFLLFETFSSTFVLPSPSRHIALQKLLESDEECESYIVQNLNDL